MGTINKILKGMGKKIGPILTEVAPGKENAVYQKVWNKKLNPKMAYGAIGVGTIAALGNKAHKSKNRHELGYMSAQDGMLSNMVGGATLSPLVEQVQRGEYDTDRINNEFNSRGAEGDIVFALHNMR